MSDKRPMRVFSMLIDRVTTVRQLFIHDSLFRNATYLMASTAVMSVLGFFFWVFVAHLYAPAQIGIASALISITVLISNLSLLGLNAGIIRFLSGSKQPSRDINAAALTVGGITILAAATYVLMASHLGGSLSLLDSSWHKVAFVVLMVSVSLNSLTDAVFISNRRGEYHTIGYTTFAVVKLVLPLLLVPFGAMGIFGAYILAMIVSLLISIYLMRRGCGYTIRSTPSWSLLRQMRNYTFHNYIGVVLAGLPSQLIPLFIIRQLGAASVAYFSMAWTMANLLYVIPSAVSQSLLAESSFNPQQQRAHIQRTIRLLSFLLVPAVLLAIVISPYLLAIFGPAYRQNGTLIFQLLSLCTLFIAVSSVGNTILNIEHRTWGIVAVQASTLLTISVSVIPLIHFGLAGVGVAFLLGSVASNLTHLWLRFIPRLKLRQALPAYPAPNELSQFLAPYDISDFTALALGNGSDNRTYSIRTKQQLFVLRIYQPNSSSDAYIDREINFMHVLAQNGIPTPTVLSTSTGKILQHATFRGTRWQYILMKHVDGRHPTTYTTELLNSMATLQARMHTIGISFGKRTSQHSQHVFRLAQIKQLLLQRVATQGFSHFDYDASNILVDKYGRINCILDFAGMRYGPLLICIYFSLEQIYVSRHDSTLIGDYIAAYELVRELSTIEKFIISCSLALRFKNPSLVRFYTR